MSRPLTPEARSTIINVVAQGYFMIMSNGENPDWQIHFMGKGSSDEHVSAVHLALLQRAGIAVEAAKDKDGFFCFMSTEPVTPNDIKQRIAMAAQEVAQYDRESPEYADFLASAREAEAKIKSAEPYRGASPG